MFGAIIGIAAKVIGGSFASGGAGGILGGGGLLGSLFNGGALKEIFNLVSNFKTNFLGGASQQPPLGNFAQPDNSSPAGANGRGARTQERLLDRIERMLDRLESLRGQRAAGEEDACQCNGNTANNSSIDRIRELLRQLVGTGTDQSQASFQFTRSQFINIQV